ncbi:MAG: hypothetical protein QOD99_3187 [Chthoniobacter sp.]|nr:hypothetical protein [Chthoniobacter sp.]
MKFRSLLSLLFLFACHALAELTPGELAHIGNTIWQNECAGTVEGLTSWNAGEDFASLGIGHFIWYPAGRRGPFDESFPKLMAFMESHGTKPPPWTLSACPWNSRAEFQRDLHGDRMNVLRKFLAGSIATQTAFLVQRMEQALPKMLIQAPAAQREKIRTNFERLTGSSRGTFALIDYVNFKGEGTLASERYQGEGWGLMQVLGGMSGDGDPVRDFAESAGRVLMRRVQNAPQERHEERWLPGWKNRVSSYAK